ncbi:MAG: S-layer homology domain-containing protein [Clostridia bacterium]|nr:S-layer homology domain-containing protein [Clostridia bacterium]
MKKIIAAIMLAAVLGSNAYAADFHDIGSHWAQNTIRRLAAMGVVNGVSATEFNPDGMVTRAEYLKMIMNLVGMGTAEWREGECLDAKRTDWYAVFLQSALDKGLIPKEMIASYRVSIKSETAADGSVTERAVYTGAFNGELPITREEMAVLTMHIYQYMLDSTTASTLKAGIKVNLYDMESISVWAQPSVRLAVAQGFIEGMEDGKFHPEDTATRAQAATIMGRIIDNK